MVGDNNDTDGGFTAVLTERANGVNVSTSTFNPSTVKAAGSSGVDMTCEGTASTSVHCCYIRRYVHVYNIFVLHTDVIIFPLLRILILPCL